MDAMSLSNLNEGKSIIKENNIINSSIYFITENFKDKNIKEFDSEKICKFCGNKFFSKYNRDRHIDSIHLKLNYKECAICHLKFYSINNHIKKCGKIKDDDVEKSITNSLIVNEESVKEDEKEININNYI